MFDLPRGHLLAYAMAAMAVLGLGWSRLADDRDAGGAGVRGAASPAAVRIERAGSERVLVHVAGAVREPGVYRLRAGSRVDDAVRAAGGPTRRAELAGVNLAAKAEDGRQIIVPRRQHAGAPAAAGSSPAALAPGQPLNLNTATEAQLDELDGVGPATARKILDTRDRMGGFGSVEELGQVPGIGAKRMAALRELVTV